MGKVSCIALIGRAPRTRKYIAEIPDDALIYSIAACWDIVPRYDACIEIHPYWQFSHPRYAPEMFKWMRRKHDFPIYTQRHYKSLRASVAYPFDEAARLANVTRGDKANIYFTSSFDYLIALAILAQPERIMIIGFDMASDTEYRYQREGAAHWLGIAAGRGINVWMPPEASLLKGELYGYTGAQWVKGERLAVLRKKAAGWVRRAKTDHARIAAQMPADAAERPDHPEVKQLNVKLSAARDRYFVCSGAAHALGELISEFTLRDIVGRQELERHGQRAQNMVHYTISRVNFWEGIITDRKKRLERHADQPEFAAVFGFELAEANQQAIKTRDDHMTWKGGYQVIKMLIDECDLIFRPRWRPSTDVIMVDVEREPSSDGLTDAAIGANMQEQAAEFSN